MLASALAVKGASNRTFGFSLVPGYAMLMGANKAETAVCRCHCSGDMAVCMSKVLAIPRSCFFRLTKSRFGLSFLACLPAVFLFILARGRWSFEKLEGSFPYLGKQPGNSSIWGYSPRVCAYQILSSRESARVCFIPSIIPGLLALTFLCKWCILRMLALVRMLTPFEVSGNQGWLPFVGKFRLVSHMVAKL